MTTPFSATPLAYPTLTPCPTCTSPVPSGGRFVAWCDRCGWNALVGSDRMRHTGPGGLADRWRERAVLAAARRAHAELLRDPDGSGSPWLGRLAVLLASVVVLATAAAIGCVVWWTVRGTGFWHWPGAVLGALVLLALLGGRPQDDALDELAADAAPALHEVVRVLATAVGARTPGRIRVGIDDNAFVRQRLLGRPELVIGLQLWMRLDWEQRTALLGHELGHLRTGGVGPWLVDAGRRVLLRAVLVLWPTAYDLSCMRQELIFWGWGSSTGLPLVVEAVAKAAQRVLALPFLGALVLLDVLEAGASQRREYAADLAGARLAGSRPMVALLAGFLDTRGWTTSLASAVRRGEDPWEVLGRLGRLPEREVRRLRLASRDDRVRADASHPPTHLRLRLIESLPEHPTVVAVPTTLRSAVDAELAGSLDRRRRDLVDELREA